jgi:hypothetical protein
MKYSTFVIIMAIISIIFGLSFLITPAWLVKVYGFELDLPGQFMTRYLGAALLGIVTILLAQRNATTQKQTFQGSALGVAIFGVIGLAIALWDLIAGTRSKFIWINIIVYAAAAIGFGIYFVIYLKKKK